MAKSPERRKNFWDEEEEDEGTGLGIAERRRNQSVQPGAPKLDDSSEIDRKINDARVLMEQTHQLYQHYFNGIEKRIPIEKIKLLETKIGELQRTTGITTTARFKITQFLAQYTTMKELWERKLRDMERK
jgi:hypothetical protein